jgi:hypothetical protein
MNSRFATGLTKEKELYARLGCIFLPESSGFLYFPFLSPVFDRNLNFCSAVTLFFRTKRSKNLRSKTKDLSTTYPTHWRAYDWRGCITTGAPNIQPARKQQQQSLAQVVAAAAQQQQQSLARVVTATAAAAGQRDTTPCWS